MSRRMDEVYQAQLEQEQQWQATLAQDPEYLAWLNALEKARNDESARRADEAIKAGHNPF